MPESRVQITGVTLWPQQVSAAGRAVVPAEWIKRCTTPVVPINEIGDYGYQWYIGRRQPFWAAVGNGGQRLFVSPKLDLVVVTTFGNYDTPDQSAPPNYALLEVVLPSMR